MGKSGKSFLRQNDAERESQEEAGCHKYRSPDKCMEHNSVTYP